jgi:ketohexokinase
MTVEEFERVADAFAAEDAEGCWWHFEVRRVFLQIDIFDVGVIDLCKGRIPETTLRCIRYLRQAQPGSTISVEVEKPNREGLVELAAEADVVFYSRGWAAVSSIQPACLKAKCANLQAEPPTKSRRYANPEACLRVEAASSKA